jgi:response regulator RpfG family c-di-GMP phosphodiesterase
MAKPGPIIIIEDDADDKEFLEEILRELGLSNRIIWMENVEKAFKYLVGATEQPFLILSDVNLPGRNGIEFKAEIDKDPELRKKSIPFVFFSTATDQKSVNEAYTKMTVQGYFQKRGSFEEMKKVIKIIIDYWEVCKHPNSL